MGLFQTRVPWTRLVVHRCPLVSLWVSISLHFGFCRFHLVTRHVLATWWYGEGPLGAGTVRQQGTTVQGTNEPTTITGTLCEETKGEKKDMIIMTTRQNE